MVKKSVLSIVLILGLLVIGSSAFADDVYYSDNSAYGAGYYHMGYGPGYHMGYGPGYHHMGGTWGTDVDERDQRAYSNSRSSYRYGRGRGGWGGWGGCWR